MMNNIDFLLTQATSVMQSAMKDDCTIEHVSSYTDDAYGSEAPGTTTTRTVKCIASPYPRLVEIQSIEGRLGAMARWRLEFPLGQGPDIGDILTINGKKLTVQLLETPQTYTTSDNVEAAEINS